LREEIASDLAPFLLAPIIARSEDPKHSQRILRRLKERFEAKAACPLTVSFSLIENPSIERALDFPNFYLQTHLVPGPGAIREMHYTLYVAGNESVSLLSPDLDADALGVAVARVFLDGIGDDLAGLFPRIASRYQQVQGKGEAMEEFLLHQLNVSSDAQDMARAKVSGEAVVPGPLPSPPPLIAVSTAASHVDALDDDRQGMEEYVFKHQEGLSEKARSFVEKLATGGRTEDEAPEATDAVTPEQRERGRRGEEEIKRRLELPGGWGTLTLLHDMRDAGCGYDFLCAMGEREVKLEVKTFVRNGRVVITSAELREAAVSQDNYYLLGVLDDAKPQREWATFLVQNPIHILLTKGQLDLQAKLRASAAEIFNLEDPAA